ncbi:high-potential iron-sulfur protein [Methylocaldum szegediense]|uniref:High-potential iron-sulfur protein n=1 Tax=Methylocaldum szegediense TaxID=73780 RepID=A0ABN8WYC9_9GAMM|nr:high-potential iron-sulfur protein [Methylocaldum szegediense]CAI8760296.1 High-potential iron-sulfur protein [Methylocaldum szegediense]
MSDSRFVPSRRQAIKTALLTVITVSLSGLMRRGQAQETSPAEGQKLSPNDPMAKSLHYVEDASKAKRPPREGTPGEQQFCHNCKFLQAGEGEWRPCSIFGGKLVSVNGWCSSWLKAG